MGIWIRLYRLVKGLKYQRIIVSVPNDKGHDTPVIEVQDGTEIDLVDFNSLIPLKLSHIGQPLLVGAIRIELAVQKVLRYILWVPGLPGAAVTGVLDRRFDTPGPADTQHSLIVDMDTLIMAQIVIDPAVALIRAFRVNMLYLLC